MATLILNSNDPMWMIPAGSETNVIGTDEKDELAICSGSDVLLDPSFNSGKDTIYLQSASDDYSVRRSGATVFFIDNTGYALQIPAGPAGQDIVFGDGFLTLQITGSAIMIGDQAITSSSTAITAQADSSITSENLFGQEPSDPPSGYSLSADLNGVIEGGAVTYTVSASQNAVHDTIFTYSVTGGSQISASDFNGKTFGYIVIEEGTKTASFTVTTTDTDETEADESFYVILMDSTGTKFIDSETTIIKDKATTTDPEILASQKSITINTTDTIPDNSSLIVQALDSGYHWPSLTLTYSFNTVIPSDYYGDNELTTGWNPLSTTQKSIVTDVFNGLRDITNLIINQNTNGDIRFNAIDMDNSIAGFAYYPASGIGGDVFISNSNATDFEQQPGDFGYSVFWHEIGHAVGLKHPFEDGVTLPVSEDDTTHTIMSYTSGRDIVPSFSYSGSNVNYQEEMIAVPSSYTLYDVAALQAVYGANINTRTGANSYTVLYQNHEYKTAWDAGGADTINASDASNRCEVNLNPGTFSGIDIHTLEQQKTETIEMYIQAGYTGVEDWVESVFSNQDITSSWYTGENNLSIAYGTVIENVTTGSGDDYIIDNKVDNTISAGSGDDVIVLSGGGYDTVYGGEGNDQLELPVTHGTAKQYYLSDDIFIIIGDSFAVKLSGIEEIVYSDGFISSLVI